MTFRNQSKFALLVVLCLLLASSVMGITEKKGTITLKDGTVYENVTYKVSKTYRVIKFKVLEEDKNISFTDIDTIIDPDGIDITARELNRQVDKKAKTWLTEDEKKSGIVAQPKKEPNQSAENWKSTEDKVYREARKKLWQTAIGFHANYSIPFSDYYEGIDGGIGFGGDFNISFTPKLSGKLVISKSGMKVSDEFGFFSFDPMITILSQDISIKTWRFLLAAQYNHRMIKGDKHQGNWYFYSGLGLVSEKISLSATIRDDYTSTTYTESDDVSDSYFLFSFGGGYQVMISPKIALDFGSNLDVIYISANGYGDVQYAHILDFKIGLTAFLGGEK